MYSAHGKGRHVRSPRHVKGEKRRVLKSDKNNQNSESKEVLVFTLSPR